MTPAGVLREPLVPGGGASRVGRFGPGGRDCRSLGAQENEARSEQPAIHGVEDAIRGIAHRPVDTHVFDTRDRACRAGSASPGSVPRQG